MYNPFLRSPQSKQGEKNIKQMENHKLFIYKKNFNLKDFIFVKGTFFIYALVLNTVGLNKKKAHRPCTTFSSLDNVRPRRRTHTMVI